MEKKASNNRGGLTEARIRRLFRWEEAPSRLLKEQDIEKIKVRKPYGIQPEDLLAVLEKQKNMPEGALEEEWAGPLWEIGALLLEDPEGLSHQEGFRGLPDEGEQTWEIFKQLLNDLAEGEADLAACEQRLKQLIAMRDQQIPLRTYDRRVKEKYIRYYEDKNHLEEALESEILLYVLFVDELCREKDPVAMRAKALALFGGNRAYACNWNKARDMLEELMGLDPYPGYGNLLGHLYLQGRTNQGRPEYEKAFRYFSIGAAGGMAESRYMLADLFRDGLGVPRNPLICLKLIQDLYGEHLTLLIRKEYDSCFPEVAFRFARIHQEGIGLESNSRAALFFALQAEYALKKRRALKSLGDDESLAEALRAMIAVLQQQMLLSFESERIRDQLPAQILSFTPLEEGDYFELKGRKNKKDQLLIRLTRHSRRGEKQAQSMLVTVPEGGFCAHVDSLRFELEAPRIRLYQAQGDKEDFSFCFDAIDGERYLLGDKICARMGGNWHLLMDKKQGDHQA